jgi:phage terminase large subunit GpA-like protein
MIELAGVAELRAMERQCRQHAFSPRSRLTVSEWADKYRVLSPRASAEPGKWRTLAYQRGIMDALNEERITRVVAMLPSQVGKTEILLNVSAYHIDAEPAPQLMVQPTLDMAQTISKDRIGPMLTDTPKLAPLFPQSRRRETDQTLLHKTFPGGHITLVGANSPAGLASRPIRVVLLDEVDRYPQSAGKEGDVASLAEKRTATFGDRRVVFMTSTPTVEGLSRIAQEYEQSDQRRFQIPCLHCATPFEWTWSTLKWEHGKPETAAIACAECGGMTGEVDKLRAVTAGSWVATHPERTVAGFTCTALISPLVAWKDLVREWYESTGNSERRRVFVNTVLAETWREDSDGINESALQARREVYDAEVPTGVGVLVGSVDTQGDRLEICVWGYGRGEESWLVYFEQLWGDPARREVWDRCALVLDRGFSDASSRLRHLVAATVDSGGHHTQQVYDFIRRRRGAKVPTHAIKGVAGSGRPLVSRPSKANKQRVPLFSVGVDTAKDLLFARLKQTTPGPGYVHLPTWADNELIAQFTAERVVVRYLKGRPVREYIKVRHRNEALDLAVYGLAGLVLTGPVREQLGAIVEKLGGPAPETPPEPPQVQIPQPIHRPQRSNWVTGGGTWRIR